MTAVKSIFKFLGEVVKESFMITATGNTTFERKASVDSKKATVKKPADKSVNPEKATVLCVDLRSANRVEVGTIHETIGAMIKDNCSNVCIERMNEIRAQFAIFTRLLLASQLPRVDGMDHTDDYILRCNARCIADSNRFEITRVSRVSKECLGITRLVIV